MPGVAKPDDDSRRPLAIFAGAGVLPAVPLTPNFLLSFGGLLAYTKTQQEKQPHQFKLLLLRIERDIQPVHICLILRPLLGKLDETHLLVRTLLLQLMYLPPQALHLLLQCGHTLLQCPCQHIRLCTCPHHLLHLAPNTVFHTRTVLDHPGLLIKQVCVLTAQRGHFLSELLRCNLTLDHARRKVDDLGVALADILFEAGHALLRERMLGLRVCELYILRLHRTCH